MKVENAETIWDKVDQEIIDFDLFIHMLKTNLLVGIEKSVDPPASTIKGELDNLCWMLCEKIYNQRISSMNPPNSINSSNTNNNNNNEKNTETDAKIRKFSPKDLFKLWKVVITLSNNFSY